MAANKARKERALDKLLQKASEEQATQTDAHAARDDNLETAVTKAFMVELFGAIKEDIQELRTQLASDLREVRRDVEDIGDRVATLEEHDLHRDKDIHQLQQEIIRLREQNLNPQAHTEDLENRSRQNNIQIRNIAWRAEGENLRDFLVEMFRQILGEEAPTDIQLDRAHRVGLPRGTKAPSSDILVCVHDFQLKELILRKAREQQSFCFRDQRLALFQDLAASTLLKRKEFKTVTNYLREHHIADSWGHPFRLIFRHEGKLVQIRSSQKALTLLGLKLPPDCRERVPSPAGGRRSPDGWQRVGKSTIAPQLDPATAKKEREAAVSSVARVTDRPSEP